MVDATQLATVVEDFCATMTQDFSVDDILAKLADSVVRVIGVDGAGIMTADDSGSSRFGFATSAGIDQVERLQELLQEGPCRESIRTGNVINVGDLRVEGRWPAFERAALDVGLRAVSAIPLLGRGRAWGVLDLYRSAPQSLEPAELRAARTLANLATSYLVVTADRDAAREAQQQIAHRAMHDVLTGLPVRWVFLEQLTRAVARLDRAHGQAAVLFLDLDGLKYVNDRHGHAAGDRLLIECVARITAALRPSDLVARIGGDEFVVLLEDTSEAGAIGVARRILGQLQAPARTNDPLPPPSASIGIALTADPRLTPDRLVAHADAAMYVAKRRGRGNYQVFDPVAYDTERAAGAARDKLRAELQYGFDHGQFEVHYQPIVDSRGLDSRAVDGRGPAAASALFAVEALLRWRSPHGGLLPAGDFLAAIEESTLMPELGAWVVRSACQQLAAWDQSLGPRTPRHMFVNLSVAELAQPGLLDTVFSAVSDAGLSTTRLTFEVTETGFAESPATVLTAVEGLRALGCNVAIDDFGSGYSSLTRLETLPATVLKIDGSFARDMLESPAAAAIVTAVVLLGRSLQRDVVVEGVESEATVHRLRELGGVHLQGFHVARPMPGEDLEQYLAERPRPAIAAVS